jgi:GTPase SAR1 family protein
MSELPLPLPDRRMFTNKSNHKNISSNYNKFSNENKYSNDSQNQNLGNSITVSESSETTSLSLIKLKQIEDMRKKILNYRLLTEKSIFFASSSLGTKINRCNVIMFGPSGSGKSSFIKSLYRALYNSPILPPEALNKLKIKDVHHNEGTLKFSQFHFVEETNNSSGIILCDTRGHFRMNENEKEQFKIILDGKVRDGTKIEQRKNRDPFALWEFWKSSSELFPEEILNPEEPGISSIPHSVVFVFDGSIDEVVQEEDQKFYKELIFLCKKKGYESVQVVLTRIDVFEKMIYNRNKKMSQSERNTKLNKLKDEKIETVIQTLGVNRSNVHFIENYHLDGQEKNSVEIDYHILKTMSDILNSAELFMMNYMNQRETCFCFGSKFY